MTTTHTEPQPKYLRQRQAVEHLKVSPATFWRLISRGDIPPPIRIGKRINLWSFDAIEKYIQSRQEGKRHE